MLKHTIIIVGTIVVTNQGLRIKEDELDKVSLKNKVTHVGQPNGEHNFSYLHGGDDWNYTACRRGKRQSPIDLPFFEEDIMFESPVPKDYYIKVTRSTEKRFL